MKVRIAALLTICAAALLWFTEPLKSKNIEKVCIDKTANLADVVDACTTMLEACDRPAEHVYLYYARRAEAHYCLGEYSNAIDDADRALDYAPSSARMLVWRAYAANALDDRATSDADFERALQFNNQDAYVLYNRAKLNRKRGEIEAAKHDYQAVLQIAPDHQDAMTQLIDLLLIEGNHDEVERLLDYSRLTWPEEEWVYTSQMFHSLEHSGDMKRALAAAETYEDLFPNSPDGTFYLALVSFRLGRDDKGITYVERYLDLLAEEETTFLGYTKGMYDRALSWIVLRQDARWLQRVFFYAGIGKTDLAKNEVKEFLNDTGSKGRKILIGLIEKEGIAITHEARRGEPEHLDSAIEAYVLHKKEQFGLSHYVSPTTP
ncbi:Tetratricopeptide repeat-containing protein [Ruegeria halocynthiae]|uniref:Tetratricopeptide repeat-containing protein n=1 Tax=Ruegeria halocynthiae TaxID=985054 RepID=A0A1H2Y8F3_9RHOB|nr:tetratricopeptide repeat protein [Ruegeria halocynthiae]SDX01320.1 Tetratricopeptide repeat-containing protein [Ruegeria halocynthiae]